MKTMMCIVLMAALNMPVVAQKISWQKVPTPVMMAFKSKFPTVEKALWEMDSKGYEAEFTLNKEKVSALFRESGTWIETETEMHAVDLPAAVKMSIEMNFHGYQLEEACRIEHAEKGSGFETELQNGKEILEVFFTTAGEVVSKEAVRDEDADDKGARE